MTRRLLLALLSMSASVVFAQDAPVATSEADAEVAGAEVAGAEADAEVADAEVADAEVADAETDSAETLVADPAAQEAESPSAAASAKFALVIVGDADATLRLRAAELSAALHHAGLTGVHDDAIREALVGQEGEDSDELGSLRRARRVLALSDDAGARAEALDLIGRASGADALVLLARRAPTLRVYDLGARSFFEAVPASPGDIPYIAHATQAAAERALTAPSLVAQAAHDETETDVESGEDIPPVRAFFKKNWPYMVAGVLLAGAIAWLLIGSRGNDDTPPPVLRFRPGGTDE